ncbi:hypothetical protein SPHINGO361_100547 [Sphingomonas sp. EC-HK361]|nr:hypothetical protein SPHINGO361_100547 [Sphingomonas sp. EC-HK361]
MLNDRLQSESGIVMGNGKRWGVSCLIDAILPKLLRAERVLFCHWRSGAVRGKHDGSRAGSHKPTPFAITRYRWQKSPQVYTVDT